ncbi:16S rRNA (cytidine(1402)-2'-O)-methyltransferase [Paracoccus sp. Z118]|uniref:16S rRNA (cytidine(1402)-2'-O)-methyltransferase n=1 Tax=Paracoccus sp. Z118 TaxID=2851017 RepID=UPI001C2C3F92|nr:16S rRNA (cytidine(1402)-2'-O)-methyltransferase [Paracoccus sp. Z118]MBV0892500.1 16S rRNA (cytidine(1402)-2'-O)-methyltransferase [Paracoccus sp. Z118]
MQDDPAEDGEAESAAGSAHMGAALAPALYLVSTPIGNARDITLRGLDILGAADVLAAEDTRTLRHLMSIHGIPLRGRRIVAHHDHNAESSARTILQAVREGRSVAYASDAGTPLVADPGFALSRQAAEEGLPVHAAPGASALLAALTVAGLPTDRFLFAGFVPSAKGARRSWLADVAAVRATVVMFESPRRVKQTLNELCEIEANRITVICRELTKKFEEVMRGTAAELAARVPDEGLRGEVVILLAPPAGRVVDDDALREALAARLERMSVRDAAAEVAAEYGVPRKLAYGFAVELGKADRG